MLATVFSLHFSIMGAGSNPKFVGYATSQHAVIDLVDDHLRIHHVICAIGMVTWLFNGDNRLSAKISIYIER